MPGRRERKKAATRNALADAALRLFLERGFEAVSVKDIAEAADVSITTLFKHFSSKEALVFDAEADWEAALIAAVQQRPPGQSVPQALLHHFQGLFREQSAQPGMAEYLELIRATPALQDYGRRLWTRHEVALAQAIAEDIGVSPDDVACAVVAHFVLEAPSLARVHPNSQAALTTIFDVIERGWALTTESSGGAT